MDSGEDEEEEGGGGDRHVQTAEDVLLVKLIPEIRWIPDWFGKKRETMMGVLLCVCGEIARKIHEDETKWHTRTLTRGGTQPIMLDTISLWVQQGTEGYPSHCTEWKIWYM